jgi:hypothetical protein
MFLYVENQVKSVFTEMHCQALISWPQYFAIHPLNQEQHYVTGRRICALPLCHA